jgi:hypothetical protein
LHAFVHDGTLIIRLINGATIRQWALTAQEVATLEQAIATWKTEHPHA